MAALLLVAVGSSLAAAVPHDPAAALQRAASARVAHGGGTLRLTEAQAIRIARSAPKVQDWLSARHIRRSTATRDAKTGVWTVDFWSGKPDDEKIEAEVLLGDRTHAINEVRTGPQVAWSMARGYDGAFGRAINKPVIWVALCVVFLVPLLRFRRLLSWRTLDLLALLSFSISLVWFNRGEIFTSVPLQYPPLVYLCGRLAWIAVSRARRRHAAPAADAPGSRRPGLVGWCPTWLLVTLLALTIALRLGLNAFNANVIDVGYAGVIGADRIEHGRTPYDTFPSDCAQCDTYGPLTYAVYVPFVAAEGWSGKWDDLPAAHGAAAFFDLLCIAGLVVLGWRLSGWRLGAGLGLAWSAFPFSAYTLESNANDALVAAMLIWGLVLVRRPLGRGLFLGLALTAKFAPAVLLLLWGRHPFPLAGRRRRFPAYAGGLALAVLASGWVILLDGASGVRAFWSRTLGYQFGRDAPFSIWGQHTDLRPVQLGLTALVLLAALAVVRWPRRLDVVQLVALSGALLIGVQLTLTYWFYLYIPWFLPFALVALVPEWPAPIGRAHEPRPVERPEPVAVTA